MDKENLINTLRTLGDEQFVAEVFFSYEEGELSDFWSEMPKNPGVYCDIDFSSRNKEICVR